jgi:hypothetical protein
MIRALVSLSNTDTLLGLLNWRPLLHRMYNFSVKAYWYWALPELTRV